MKILCCSPSKKGKVFRQWNRRSDIITLIISDRRIQKSGFYCHLYCFHYYGASSRSIRLHLPLGEKGELLPAHTLSWQLSTGWRYQYKIRWWSTATSESVLGAAASQLSCCCVGKGLKLEEDLIKPNPTKSVHWLKLSQARGIATVLMYGERRKHIEISKDYARGN